ncbi:restriction endonuclease subunit S [Sphingobium sp. AP49]|uniref:restriction endonuclease subunit S n=1 Tax=Sphingobium sp. AP49 TaxID=1144307 RepID=UPI00026EE4F0|nr:restriction endonuclease subunit S [Sphingobium sp. AP49]WHO37622.1 restriction endonuclease subunit S [Sphingobium sp. AP49]
MAGDWPETTWGNIAELKYGKAMTAYTDQPNVARVYGTNGPIGWHDTALQPGPGVIVGRKGAYRGVHYADHPFWVIDTAYYLNPLVPMDLRWAYYWLLDYDVNNIDDGSPIPSTTREAFGFTPLKLPPLNEQERIADLLASLDAKIDLNCQMAATLEEMARSLFKSWFVDFDPVHAKLEGRDIGLPAEIVALFPGGFGDEGVPTGWNRKPIIDLAHWINGAAYKNMHFVSKDEGLPVIKIAELKAGITSKTKFTGTDLGGRYKINDRELLFSWSGNPETSIDTFLWMNGEAWLNQHIFAVRENGELSQPMLHAMLKFLKPIFTSIARDKQTIGLGHVTKEDMGRVFVALPKGDLLCALRDVFDALFEQYAEMISQNIALEATKTTLLPRLVSGELRVKEAAERVAAA